MYRTALAVSVVLTMSVQQSPAQQRYAAGQEVRVCGEVIAKRTNPSTCETMLRVASSGEEFDVLIPASVREDLSPAPERLRGAAGCFTGRIALAPSVFRISVASASGIQITALPPGPAFGAGAAVPCGGPVTMPRVIAERKPQYTTNAMRAGVQGTVEMEAVVDSDGTISDARVIRPLHAELDEQALAAVKEWRFVPGMLNGKPVPVLVDIEMSFALERRR